MAGQRTAGRAVGSAIGVAAGLALAGMVIAPALMGSFMQSRLATTDADFGIRTRPWNDAIDMMTNNWSTTLFGMGLGRYPATYQLLSTEKTKPAVHRFEAERANTFLHIAPGATLYVEQIVSVAPGHDYQVGLKARAQGQNASVNVLICDRTFLEGFGCQSATFQLSGEAGKWQQFQATLNLAAVGGNRMRTTKLSLENASPNWSVDLDDVRLVDSDGVDHIANGGFKADADVRWAIDQAVAANPRFLLGPDTDSLLGDMYRSDGCHLNASGLKQAAKAWAAVLLTLAHDAPYPI